MSVEKVSVADAAKQFGVSERRVRSLLLSGRLKGEKNEVGHWLVQFPYIVQMGRRGPALFAGKSAKAEVSHAKTAGSVAE